LVVLSVAESSSVVASGSMAVWESWEARETMVTSMSSLESPLEADPVILMSFLRCVPVIQGSRWTTKLVQKHLNAVARDKRRLHSTSDRPFRPFVLCLGGVMETDARDALKLWKSIMTGGVYSLLVRRLSLGLLRARGRCFEP
jgi:hypothetical protein